MGKDFMKRMETLDEFEQWLQQKDAALKMVTERLAKDGITLDYSIKSIEAIEKWILTQYEDVKEAFNPEGIALIDALGRYIGEIVIREIGGEWTIDVTHEDYAYYGYAGISGFTSRGGGGMNQYPWTSVTTAIARRTGTFMRDSLINKYLTG